MSLLDTQRGFRDHILAGAQTPLAGIAPAAECGLAVYRHAYRAQLIACLRDTYEKTWAWMGDEAFDRAALAHVEQTPPSSWTLSEYGAGFPQSLRTLFPADPEVADLAWLDWSLRRAFDGPNADAIAPQALAAVDWDNAVLHFLPTLTVGEVVTNCAAIWGALGEEQTPPGAERLPAPAAIRVWRSDLTPRYRSIENFEHRALILAMAGSSFADLCNLLTENGDREATVLRIGGVLASWLQDGLIRDVRDSPR